MPVRSIFGLYAQYKIEFTLTVVCTAVHYSHTSVFFIQQKHIHNYQQKSFVMAHFSATWPPFLKQKSAYICPSNKHC